MRLILSGGWLGEEGLFKAKVRDLKVYNSLKDFKNLNYGFALFSYSLSSETLGLQIKSGNFPPIVCLEIDGFERLSYEQKEIRLERVSSSFTAKDYIDAVKEVKRLISEGVVYQLNLTCRFDFLLYGDPLDLFVRYYMRQPVPYAFFLDLEDFYVISGSMELFLKKEGDLILSKPIKGTAKNKEDLLKSEKDKAENLMITDMVRNDLSRIALSGSVEVTELFKIEEYKTLFQMHSTVRARTEKSLQEILKETFPPASVVGAPKRKAVEVIDQLEPHSRDYYCGAGGLIKGRDFLLSVLIRTAIGSGRRVSYFAGAGIVWDSSPEREWQEVLLKTQAFDPVY
ncbi:MAG: chorismate-binding protein [Aquificaceae bacterium]